MEVSAQYLLTAQVRGRHDPSFDIRCVTHAPWQRRKADGALHSVKPINLVAGLLRGAATAHIRSIPARSMMSCWLRDTYW